MAELDAGPTALLFAGTRPERTSALVLVHTSARFIAASDSPIGVAPERLHTGEIELRDSDVGGIAVHIAARVMAAADPGRIVTSRTVHDLVVSSDIAMDDLGTRPLKGVDGTWQLFAARP